MTTRGRLITSRFKGYAALLFLSFCAFSQLAQANMVVSIGSAANYGVLGLAGSSTVITTTLDNSLVTINGNEGISQFGSINNMAPSKVNGNVYEYSSGEYTGPGTVTGSINVSPATLTMNDSDVATALSDIGAETADLTFGSITTAQSVTASGPVTVVQVNGDINLNNANFTVNGSAGQQVIVRVTGSLALVGTASLNIAGGITANDVIYDFTGSSSDSINTHVGDTINGVVIAPNLDMTLDGTFNGELIGGNGITKTTITLMSGAIVNQPPFSPVPEPKTVTMLGAMLLGIGFLAARKKNLLRS